MPSVIDERAQQEPDSVWVSITVDEREPFKGFKEITYSQFANAVNHAVHWLSENLPASPESFQPFAYAGPKDLRYPILAVAVGKLEKVVSAVLSIAFRCFLLFPNFDQGCFSTELRWSYLHRSLRRRRSSAFY